MFYEFRHPIEPDYFTVSKGENLTFPAHLHHCFELIIVTSGEMSVTVGGREYELKPGTAVMIFPNQIHSIRTKTRSEHIIAIFSPTLVSFYSSRTSGKLPDDPVFTPDEFYVRRLSSGSGGILEMKGTLYSLCAEFDKGRTYIDSDGSSDSLLAGIFAFIDKNYDSDCSLEVLSKNVGYGYTYLSSFFRKAVGMSYHDYVTDIRISKVCHLLENSDEGILQIANECGFGSLRSLNRNFREKLGVTPTEYRFEIMRNNARNV